jgi:AsmA protein
MNVIARPLRILLWTLAALFAPALLAVLYIALFGWNWLRSPLERLVVDQTGRVLVIQGDLTVNIGWPTLRLHAAQLRFANPAWAQEKQMVAADRVAVSIDVPALLQRKLVFPEVTLNSASVFLEQSTDGRKSWLLDLEQRDEAARIQIGRVALNRGALGYDDASQKTSIRAELSTAPQVVTGSSATDLRFSVVGHYKGEPLKAQGSGGPVLALRETTLPYPLTLDGTVGQTGVHLNGTVTGLLALTAVDMHMSLRGPSLEQLFPLLGIAFPETRSYATQGHLIRTGNTWRYQEFTGRVGTSDIAGFVQVVTGGKRPALSADLHSELLDLDELATVIGARPDKVAPTATAALAQQRVLPDLPFKADRWNSVDADVQLHAAKLRRGKALPLDKLEAHLHLLDSVLTLDPLNFGLAGGQLSTKITLDGRTLPIQARAQVRARKVLLAQLFPTIDLSKSSIGQVNGEFDLTGSGNSVGHMLASASGKLGLVVAGGQISKLLMEKAGLHLWEILSLNLSGDRLVKLRCAVADFNVKRGVMQTEALVFDTQVTTLIGTGTIDLAQEQLDITLNPKTKNTSPVALRSPIYLRGSFAKPRVEIDKVRVTARAVGAVVLGAINPLLALIPLIDAGPGKDSDCAQLVHDARAWPRAQPTTPQRRQ